MILFSWRTLVVALRTCASDFEEYEFDNLFEGISEHEPELAIDTTNTAYV